jgi:hypothetical protein
VGHKPEKEMRGTYTHINTLDDKTFYEKGKCVIDMLDKFVFSSAEEEEIKKEKIVKAFEEHKDLIKNGRILYEDLKKIINPLLVKPKQTTSEKDADDFFTSV